MTLFGLAASLPNGLHDCEVSELFISYADRTVRFTLDVWIGDMDAQEESREEYRPGVVEIRDFEYCILDRPDPRYPYKNRRLTVDLAEPDPKFEVGTDGNACRLWVGEWNAFIHIRADKATLNWTGPSVYRTHDAQKD